jgi:hypothetical protein
LARLAVDTSWRSKLAKAALVAICLIHASQVITPGCELATGAVWKTFVSASVGHILSLFTSFANCFGYRVGPLFVILSSLAEITITTLLHVCGGILAWRAQ